MSCQLRRKQLNPTKDRFTMFQTKTVVANFVHLMAFLLSVLIVYFPVKFKSQDFGLHVHSLSHCRKYSTMNPHSSTFKHSSINYLCTGSLHHCRNVSEAVQWTQKAFGVCSPVCLSHDSGCRIYSILLKFGTNVICKIR